MLKTHPFPAAFVTAAALAGLLSGCGREPEPPAPVSRTEAPVPATQTGAGLDNVGPADRVREALRSNQQVSTLTIDVIETPTGVLLTGSVPSIDQRDWADRVARTAAGPAVVRNELKVAADDAAAGSPRPSDSAAAAPR